MEKIEKIVRGVKLVIVERTNDEALDEFGFGPADMLDGAVTDLCVEYCESEMSACGMGDGTYRIFTSGRGFYKDTYTRDEAISFLVEQEIVCRGI